MRKNPHDKILKREPKEQHLSTIPKTYPINKYLLIIKEMK